MPPAVARAAVPAAVALAAPTPAPALALLADRARAVGPATAATPDSTRKRGYRRLGGSPPSTSASLKSSGPEVVIVSSRHGSYDHKRARNPLRATYLQVTGTYAAC
ncbi:hypothetical protein GCM10009734_78560 [Nonomuraea bangladeshensis]